MFKTKNLQKLVSIYVNIIHNFSSLKSKQKGILGMGYDSLSVQNVTTVFTNLFEQHQIKGNKFSFWLDRLDID